jgi:AdoMet-dependent heme synthase
VIPHIVAWNLTDRCNLACAHCYISAGSWQSAAKELDTAACHRIVDEILEVNPNPMLILSGGEPLLREDLESIARRATEGGATVVVGTNGTRLTDARIDSLMGAGVKGVAVSVDSLDATYHDRFRHGGGALDDTLAAIERLRMHRLDFVVQTSLTRGNRDELRSIVAWAAEKGAISFNLYFLVPTGRGSGMQGLPPGENEAVLVELMELEREYRGRMMIRSKCQPQLMRHVVEGDPESPLLNYATRCPCGTQYCRITPEGKVTPCPYMPVEAGDLKTQSFREIWEGSEVFLQLREGELSGRCGRCEYREVCGGCRARAYANTDDILGPDDSCAYDPPGGVALVEPKRALTYGGGGASAAGTGRRATAGATAGARPRIFAATSAGVSAATSATPPDGAGSLGPDDVARTAARLERIARDQMNHRGGAEPDAAPLPWTPEAVDRLQGIPSFVRGVVTARIEGFARERGHAEVDLEVMAEVRRNMPVDFSKRLPFFLRPKGEA